jgi:DNA-binding transcriptional MerR regulator
MSEEGFSSQTAATLAGITYRQLDHWARSGFVQPSLSPALPGTGRRRRYSFTDVVALRTAGELLRAGVSLQALRRVVAELQRLRENAALVQARLIVDGDDVLLVEDSDGALSVLRRPGQRVLRFVVDVGDVVRQLAQAAPARPPSASSPATRPQPQEDAKRAASGTKPWNGRTDSADLS